jgi:YVTN family beta-propeller protein
LLAFVALGAVAAGKTHMRWMSGRQDLSGVKGCWTCHAGREHLAWQKPRPHHASPAGLAVSRDGRRLWVALDDLDQVAEIDIASRAVTRRAPVAGGPTALVLDAAGQRLYVTCRNGDRVTVLDTTSLSPRETVATGNGPTGLTIVATPGGDRLVVANSISNDISVLSASPLREVARLAAGREPYAVTAGPGRTALVVARMSSLVRGDEVPSAETTVVDAGEARIVRRIPMESAHLSEGAALTGAAAPALIPIVRVRNLVPITQVAQGWVMSSGLARLDPSTGAVDQLPLDEANRYYADPSGIAVDAVARRAFVASAGGDAVTAIDLARLEAWLLSANEARRRDAIDDLQLSGEYVLARIPTGRNPRQLALSPDGAVLFVAERLDDAVLLVDTKSLAPVGRVSLGDGGNDDPLRRGEVVFARASTTFQSGFSCRSCHPDAHVDGLTYDFDIDGVGKDVLDNRSLQGLAGTEPFKWNGKNPSLKVQCGPRFAKVLTRAAPFAPKDLDDLDAFLVSLPPTRTEHDARAPLTDAQARGKRLFSRAVTMDGRPIPYALRCSTCHRPPIFTDRLPADVETRGPNDSTSRFDTPHLLGIASSAPYLHDGRAATLEEIWTLYNPHDRHGVTNDMSKIQLNELIEYLKTL